MSFYAKEWDTAYINDLPDSAFAYIVKGEKEEGKTVPRTNRNLPHLRNAMARVTHTNLSKTQQKEAHDHLLRHYKQLGMEHPKCSVPGCQGYAPKKSMLEDTEGFRAYQEAWFRSQGKRAVLVT